MTMWNLSVGLILFTLLPVYLNALTLKFRTKPGPLNYVRLGDTLKLNVTYDFDGMGLVDVIWYFGIGHGEKVKKDGNNHVQTLDDRATIEGPASLVLENTTLKDNTTFTVRISSFGVPNLISSFQVIIQVKPDALTDCNQSTEVNQGENVACRCYSAKQGNPPHTAFWYKDGSPIGEVGDLEKTLSLNNVTVKDNGTYICRLQSLDLISETFVHVLVTFKPESVEFSSDKTNNVVALRSRVVIKCLADGYPTPTYNISLNGADLTTGVVDGVKIIENATNKDAGLYECVAENKFGKNSSSFTLHVQVVSTSVTVVTSRPSTIFSSSLVPNLTTTTPPTAVTSITEAEDRSLNDRSSASVIDVTATYSFTASSSSSIKTKSNDSDTHSSPDKLSTAKIAWITCGIIVGLLFLLILIYVCVKRPDQDTSLVYPINTTDNVKLRELNEQESPPQKQLEEQEQTNKFTEAP